MIFLICATCLIAEPIFARVLTVGPNGEFSKPSKAAKASKNGDVIEIDAAGDYFNDHAKWNKNDLIIRGVNGRPHIKSYKDIKNRKGIWIIKGNNIKVSNVEFSGAKVKSRNGAAIRLLGTNFYLSDCYIHDNENGILTGKNLESEVVIEKCEFANNGFGKGKTHNIYIGKIKRFTLKNSYSHSAKTGHLVKSRAKRNYILYNRLFEKSSSYAIDLPNGGQTLVLGNIIYQGQDTKNSAVVSFGAEMKKHRIKYEINEMIFAYNSVLNEKKPGAFVIVKRDTRAMISNNLFSGPGKVTKGNGDIRFGVNFNNTKIYREFIADNIIIADNVLSEVEDKAKHVKDFQGNVVVPKYQIVNGEMIKRKKLGVEYDIGAIELESLY